MFYQRCFNDICQYDKWSDQIQSQDNRPTVQFQSINGHAQKIRCRVMPQSLKVLVVTVLFLQQ